MVIEFRRVNLRASSSFTMVSIFGVNAPTIIAEGLEKVKELAAMIN